MILSEDDNEVEMGSHYPVILTKVFGPLAFDDLRITASAETHEWIIERERDCDDDENPERDWVEVCRVPGTEE